MIIPMDTSSLYQKWKEFVARMNEKGVPLPTARDPKTGIGSVSLTLVAVSFALCVLGILTKWSGKIGGIDVQTALELFYASSALYFGRNLSTKKGTILGSSDSAPEAPKPQAPKLPKADDPDA
jgi:hypothetical protein